MAWGTYDTGKPRIRLLHAGLEAAGVKLHHCHVNPWYGIEDKSQIRGLWKKIRILTRWLLAYPRLVWNFLRARKPDVVLVGFPGLLDIIVVAPLARMRGVPLVWDMFMSLYDTVVEDRRILPRESIRARLLYAVERFALHRADLVFLDTHTHARRVENLFGLTEGSIGSVWVGAETEHFERDLYPAPPPRAPRAPLKVLFYGQFIPLHGIETIVRAARIVSDQPIQWQLVGSGQEEERIRHILEEYPLPNVIWEPWVDYVDLPQRILTADLCLGIFGTSEKAASVIPNKIFQVVAMGKPLVTRDSPAIREILEDNPPCVRLVTPGDPEALALAVCDALESLPDKPCHELWSKRLGAGMVGEQCAQLLLTRLGLEA
ncbi:glycosyltransferase [Oleiagrimonas sp.]|uniref:glycosyltransferase n=1 Tax=Oleiagrimonas sp. TaxID=2010330 RepID=UPI002614D182|nr:glycosyltransferase [Oleiagrimonas sp.]MDA3913413.1 glycosyltransferase [Oleiagrimonas sp.]